MDRATGYEPVGRAFESLRAHHSICRFRHFRKPPKMKTPCAEGLRQIICACLPCLLLLYVAWCRDDLRSNRGFGGNALFHVRAETPTGVIGQVEDTAGKNSQHQCGGGGEGKAEARGDADAAGFSEAGGFLHGCGLFRLCVNGSEKLQVVEASDAAVDEAYDAEPHVAGLERPGKDVELAKEAAGEGNTNERKQKESEQRGEDRAPHGEALVVLDRAQRLVVSANLGNDGEGADAHCG